MNPFDLKSVILAKDAQHVTMVPCPIALIVVSLASVRRQQAGLVGRAKTSWHPPTLLGAPSGRKFVVSRAGGAYDARDRGRNLD